MAAGREGEVLIFHADVDARLKSGVDIIDPVGGEEENAFIVFEDAEEDYFVFSL